MSRSSELAMAVRERERYYGQMNDEELRIFVLKYSKDKQPKPANDGHKPEVKK